MGSADLANLSDKLMLTTVVLYIIALVSYAADLGFSRRGAASRATAAGQAEKEATVLVGAAGAETAAADGRPKTAGAAADAAGSGEAGAEETGGRSIEWARFAVLLNVLGWAAHLGTIVTRGLAGERWPWGNMYEFLTAITFAAVTAYLVVLWRFRARFLGAFVVLAAVVGLGVANIWLYDSVGPVVPALNSYWIAIHVTAAIVATGAFTVGGASTVLYLVRLRHEEKAAAGGGGVLDRLPGSEALDRLAVRTTMFAFPIWTAAIVMGAIWADEAWGRYWGWDPKEIWSFVTWVVYAAYLHARATAGWKGRRAAILSLLGFAALLFNFFGVNYLFSGLHSYA